MTVYGRPHTCIFIQLTSSYEAMIDRPSPPTTSSSTCFRDAMGTSSSLSFTVLGLVSRSRSSAPSEAISSQLRWSASRLTKAHERSPSVSSFQSSTSYAAPKQATSTLPVVDSERPYICAISENTNVGKEVGIALFNMETGRCIVSQFADSQTYGHLEHILSVRACSVALLPIAKGRGTLSSFAQTRKLDSLRQILEQMMEIVTVDVPRATFDDSAGFQYAERLLVDDLEDADDTTYPQGDSEISALIKTRTSVLSALGEKFYALSALAALFKYLEDNGPRCFAPRSIWIRFEAPEGTVLIDHRTAKDLELVRNAITKRLYGSLLGTLDTCKTQMGKRLLRMNILQPLSSPEIVVGRQNALEELLANSEMCSDLQTALKTFGASKSDLDKIISQLLWPLRDNSTKDAKAIESKLQNIILLRQSLTSVRNISTALEGAQSHLWRAVQPLLSSRQLRVMLREIEECIESDLLESRTKGSLNARNIRLLAVKTGRDSVLDAARQTYKENTADALDLCMDYRDMYDLPLSAVFSTQATGGYTLEMPVTHVRLGDLPKVFINISKKKNGKVLSMSTIDLKKLNHRIHDSASEIFRLSEGIVEALRLHILRQVGHLFRASEAIAVSDMMVALTNYSNAPNRVRPKFGHELSFHQGRHPILTAFDPEGTIPNNTNLNVGKPFVLMGGPNNSGKTTYLKQVGLLLVMAHIGCFVPAEKATLFPVRQVFSLLTNHEDVEANLSTFATEVKDMAFILESATTDSVVLIDELGRNTSTHDGFAIAHACSETLLGCGAPTIFATHFAQLAMTLSPYPGVECHHFSANIDSFGSFGKSAMQHRLVSGVIEDTRYGLVTAESCNLPIDLLDDASGMASKLSIRPASDEDDTDGMSMADGASTVLLHQRTSAVIEAVDRLKSILHSSRTLAPHELRSALLQEQYRLSLAVDNTFLSTTPFNLSSDPAGHDVEMSGQEPTGSGSC